MTPEYLEELANLADPNELWRLAGMDLMELPIEKRRQLDAGVALRRYASHLRNVGRALQEKRSWLITPLGHSVTARMMVDTPPNHERLRRDEPPAAPAAQKEKGDDSAIS